MANAVVYVDSTASGANNGTSWTDAYTTLVAAIAASGTTGTDFYVYNGHTESGTTLTLGFKGVTATPDRVFSCDRTNSPPHTSDLLAGAAFSSTSGSVTITGYFYGYGLAITGATTNNGVAVSLGNNASSDILLDTCTLSTTNNSNQIISCASSGGTALARVRWLNCTYQVANSGSYISNNGGNLSWVGGSISNALGATPTNLFSNNTNTRFGLTRVEGVDLSAMSSKTLVNSAAIGPTQFINCQLPGTITLANAPNASASGPYDFIVTDSTVVNSSSFIQTRYMYQGTLTADNTVYNGATDGVNPISWKVVTTANANPQSPFECFEIVQWVTAGTYASSTIVATSATGSMTNSDLWVTTEYLGNSSYPIASRVTTGNSPQLPQGSSPTSLATGATWAVGGAGTNYTLAIPSFTTSLAGYVRFKVRVAKPSITVYVDPKVTVA